ncbi:hypothetical protein CF326_g2706 [Tilletia indica]|nr:hypothetical protein CF326_g2706 [Tilletia indica]
MTTTAPTRQQILRLYRRYLSTSQSFSSYNFRTYFLRRSRDMFRSALLPASQATTSSPFSKAADITAPVVPSALVKASQPAGASPFSSSSSIAASVQHEEAPGTPEERLAIFYERASKELDVLRRAAIVNRIYQGERLVVEEPRLIVGGGGSGAEASVGGGGQPV